MRKPGKTVGKRVLESPENCGIRAHGVMMVRPINWQEKHITPVFVHHRLIIKLIQHEILSI